MRNHMSYNIMMWKAMILMQQVGYKDLYIYVRKMIMNINK